MDFVTAGEIESLALLLIWLPNLAPRYQCGNTLDGCPTRAAAADQCESRPQLLQVGERRANACKPTPRHPLL